MTLFPKLNLRRPDKGQLRRIVIIYNGVIVLLLTISYLHLRQPQSATLAETTAEIERTTVVVVKAVSSDEPSTVSSRTSSVTGIKTTIPTETSAPVVAVKTPRPGKATGIPPDKIAILTYYTVDGLKNAYEWAISTLRCYARRNGHQMIEIDEAKLNDEQKKTCGVFTTVFFRKHCLLSLSMASHPTIDWFYIMDADTGVANPDHKLHQWIDDRFDLIFYERFRSWEIMSGNYIARNTPYARQFLMSWAKVEHSLSPKLDWSVMNYDNGAVHVVLLRAVYEDIPEVAEICANMWYNTTSWEDYVKFTQCATHYMRHRRCSKHIRLLRKAHAWVIDRDMINNKWGNESFMQHGWKKHQIGNNNPWSLTRLPNGTECEPNSQVAWPLRPELKATTEELRMQLLVAERGNQVQKILG